MKSHRFIPHKLVNDFVLKKTSMVFYTVGVFLLKSGVREKQISSFL